MEDAQEPDPSRAEESASMDDAQAQSSSRAGEMTAVAEAQPQSSSRARYVAPVQQAHSSSMAGELATVEEGQALSSSRADELAIVEASEPSTSEPRLLDGLALELSSSNPRPPSKKRKASAPSTSKGRGKSPAAGKPPAVKKRKQARKAPPRQQAPKYFVHETDNDMLLIISNEGEGMSDLSPSRNPFPWRRKAPLKKKRQQGSAAKVPPRKKSRKPVADARLRETRRGCYPSPPAECLLEGPADGRWGEQLPVEILVRIFQFLVGSEGAVPSLCRISRVCRLWQGAAANPLLWQKVSLNCWMAPQKKLQPRSQKLILATVQWLAANRFSFLQDFSLNHWKSQVPSVVKILADSCHHLTSLKLSHCAGVSTECLVAMATQCPKLENLNLQNSQVDSRAVVSFLEVSGLRLRRLWLTYGVRLNSIFTTLSSGCCWELRFLEVTTEIKQGTDYLEFSIESLQAGCPKLQVLHLLNVIWSPKSRGRFQAGVAAGFPELEELSLATSSFSFIGDNECLRILQTSSKLRVLDLRGCYRVTPSSLQKLPCKDLENLYLGLYFNYNTVGLPKEGSHLLTWKWPHSLRELDLMGQGFCEEDLDLALVALAQNGSNPVLRSLNLASTKVTLKSVLEVIKACPLLTYLNLTSCRCLPRGVKRAYSGRPDIQQCLQKLGCSESTDLPEAIGGATKIR